MNTELTELDAWIAENVMGWKILPSGNWRGDGNEPTNYPSEWNPTTDHAAAMEVLKKCAEKLTFGVEISIQDGEWCVWQMTDYAKEIFAKAPTLELAICRFARKLF